MSSNSNALIIVALIAAALLSFPMVSEGKVSSPGVRISVMTASFPQVVTHTEYVPVWEYVFIPRYINTTEIVYRNNTEYVYVYVNATPLPTPTPAPTSAPSPTPTATPVVSPSPTPTIIPTPTPSPTPPPLPENVRIWDENNDGIINKDEAIRTIRMYFLNAVSKTDAMAVIIAYFG